MAELDHYMAADNPNLYTYLTFSKPMHPGHWASATIPRQLTDAGWLRVSVNVAAVT